MTSVFDADEVIKNKFDCLGQRLADHAVHCANLVPPVNSKNLSPFPLQDHVVALQTFEDQCVFPAERSVPVDVLVKNYGLRFHPDDLKVLNNLGLPDTASFNRGLTDMVQSEKMSKVRLLQLQEQLQVWATPTRQTWMTRSIMELYEQLHADALKFAATEVASKEDALTSLHYAHQRLLTERKQAELENNIVKTEETTRLILTTLQEVLQIRKERLLQWLQSHQDVAEHMRIVNESHVAAKDNLVAFDATLNVAHSKINLDITALEAAQNEEVRLNAEAIAEFKVTYRAGWEALRSNAQEHERIWADIVRLHRDLAAVAKTRGQIADSIMIRVAEERKREMKYSKIVTAMASYLVELRRGQEYTEQCQLIARSFEKYSADVYACVQVKGFTERVIASSVKESQAYLADLQDYVNERGDLATRKEQLLDSLNRQVRGLKHSLDLAREALDPNVEQYEITLADLYARKADSHRDLLKMHADLDREVNDFSSAEEILREAKIEFVHPVLSHQDAEVEARNSMVRHMTQHLETEQTEVENAMTNLRKIVMNASVEREQSRSRPQSSKIQARHTGPDELR